MDLVALPPSPTAQVSALEETVAARAKGYGHVFVTREEMDALIGWAWEGAKAAERRATLIAALKRVQVPA